MTSSQHGTDGTDLPPCGNGTGQVCRRTVLASAGAAGVAGVTVALAGCGAAQNAAGDAASKVSGAASAAKEAISKATIPVGGGKVFPDQKVVVTQPTSGDYKAFTAVCTHQACIVSDVSNGTINCACHGSEYDIATGAVKRGPATAPLAAKKITVGRNGIEIS